MEEGKIIDRKRMYDFIQSNDVLDFEKKTVKNLIKQYLDGKISKEGFDYLQKLELIIDEKNQKQENNDQFILNSADSDLGSLCNYIELDNFQVKNPIFTISINVNNGFFKESLYDNILKFEKISGIKCNTILMDFKTNFFLDRVNLVEYEVRTDVWIGDERLVCGYVIKHEGKYFIHKNYLLIKLN